MKLALSGKMFTGKTTFAKDLGIWGFQRLSFADPLKDYCCQEFGITREQLEEHKNEYRAWLQQTGQAMKVLHKDDQYWTKVLLAKLDGLSPKINVVIDDVRFPYELEPLEKRGFLHCHMMAPHDVRLFRGRQRHGPDFVIPDPEHISETALDGVLDPKKTVVLRNDTTLTDTSLFAKMMLCKLLELEIGREKWWQTL